MIRLALLLGMAVLCAATAASAGELRSARVVGEEVPPISSTRGTFVGAAHGGLVGAWRIRIEHEPLRTGPTVAITGGAFSMLLDSGHRLGSAVVGGSVTVAKPGSHCRNQVYRVNVQLAAGSFRGTLTHRRHSIFGHCLIYGATISGRASLET